MKEQKIRIRFSGYDHHVLDRAVREVLGVAKRSGAKICGPIPFPSSRMQMTVLRSPHINKTARDQFKRSQYNRVLELSCTSHIVEALHELNLTTEVGVEIRVL